jgi:hypothetical protein
MSDGNGRFPANLFELTRLPSPLTGLAAASKVEGAPMTVPKIQIGQLWKKNDSGEVFLVTRVYTEALSTIVVLRKSGSESEALIRVKVDRTPEGPSIPGFVLAQSEDKF